MSTRHMSQSTASGSTCTPQACTSPLPTLYRHRRRPQAQIKGRHCASMDDAWVRDVDGHVDEECANIAEVEADYVLTSSTPTGTRRQYNNVDHLICNTELPEPPKVSPSQRRILKIPRPRNKRQSGSAQFSQKRSRLLAEGRGSVWRKLA